MAEQRAVEVQRVWRGFLDGLLLAVGNVDVSLDDQVVGRDAVAVLLQLLGVEADDVLAHTPMRTARRDRNVVLARPLDGLLAASHGHPDGWMRLLHRARPQRNVTVLPEASVVRKRLLSPRAANDLEALLEARSRLTLRHVEHVVLTRDAAGETRDDA